MRNHDTAPARSAMASLLAAWRVGDFAAAEGDRRVGVIAYIDRQGGALMRFGEELEGVRLKHLRRYRFQIESAV